MATGRKLDLEIEGKQYAVQIDSLTPEKAQVHVNGRPIEVVIKPAIADKTPASSAPPPTAPQSSKPSRAAPQASSKTISALLPGVVVKILVSQAQEVASGDSVLILEAMKMENEIRANRSGKIAEIHVATGQKVQTGDPLVTFE